MAEKGENKLTSVLVTGGVLIGAAVGIDYVLHGNDSILGRMFSKPTPSINQSNFPTKFGETSTSPWEVPVPTLRKSLPISTRENTDSSGAIHVPMNYEPEVKSGMKDSDMDSAAWEVAKTVFEDLSPYEPTIRFKIGDTKSIHDHLMYIFNKDDCPEILVKLAKFHSTHGHNVYLPGSALRAQQQKLVGTAADAYESLIGVSRMYSRTGDENAHEYDSQNDRLAAMGSESPIFFRVQGGYPSLGNSW